MNKKIKIIEILDNYADEKTVVMPQYVKYLDRNINEEAIMLVCQKNIIDKLDKNTIRLNDEVEILEDNIEEINKEYSYVFDGTVKAWSDNEIIIIDKIHEIIKAINELRKEKEKWKMKN